MAISKKKRFEIFKRDRFSCQYCGLQSPEVVLEVDHILPVSKGGSDEDANLTTACFNCNRGKTNGELHEAGEPIETRAVQYQIEKMSQLRELNKLLSVERAKEDKYLAELGTYFWGEDFTFTEEQTMAIRPLARKINIDKLKELMDATKRKSASNPFNYFIGCCRGYLEMKGMTDG